MKTLITLLFILSIGYAQKNITVVFWDSDKQETIDTMSFNIQSTNCDIDYNQISDIQNTPDLYRPIYGVEFNSKGVVATWTYSDNFDCILTKIYEKKRLYLSK